MRSEPPPHQQSWLDLPPDWRLRADPDTGVLLSALAPAPGATGLVPSIRLEVEPVDLTHAAWADDSLRSLGTRLPGFHLEKQTVGGRGRQRVGHRRFLHRRGRWLVVTRQWTWLVAGLGFTMSGSCGRDDETAYSDCFASVAGSFSPPSSPWRRLDSRSATAYSSVRAS